MIRYLGLCGLITLCLFSSQGFAKGPLAVVGFDATHAPQAGNADWTISGAYSDLARFLEEDGFEIREHRAAPLSLEALEAYDVFVLPEPNEPFSLLEMKALRAFVAKGGGLLMIADHSGSDRDGDSWDSVDILTRLGAPMGLYFHHRWFTEVPLGGEVSAGPLTRWVEDVPVYGATTMGYLKARRPSLGALKSSVKGKGRGRSVLGGVRFASGRVVAFGDSSPFDDGSGDPKKKLHDSFNSFLYDIRQVASNIFRFLAKEEPRKVSSPQGVSFLSDFASSQSDPLKSSSLDQVGFDGALQNGPPRVLLDAHHFNDGVDKTTFFRKEAKELGVSFVYGDIALDSREGLLAGFDVIIIDNPSKFFTMQEKRSLRDFVERGGTLLLSCRGGGSKARGRQQQLNDILSFLGASSVFTSHQVFDDERNYGRPWSLVIEDLEAHPSTVDCERVLFWNPCPVLLSRDEDGYSENVRVIARAFDSARVVIPEDLEGELQAYPYDELVLAAEERIAKGRVLLFGTSTYSDYQYTKEREEAGLRKALGVPEHQTPRLNRNIIFLR